MTAITKPVDGDPNWGAVVNAALDALNAGKAELAGSILQIFKAANAVTPGDVVNLGQADGRYAALAGLVTQAFSVADGASGKQAVNISQFLNSLSGSGYQKLPGGLIIQWGTFTTNGAGYTNITFPVAFPTGLQSIVSGLNSGAISGYFINFMMASKTTTTIPCVAIGATGSGTYATSINWIAFGY